jgi:undecaprenyl diphosphate synthase
MIKRFFSSTTSIPAPDEVPKHIAIIMDGNGRWAKKRLMPRVAGHAQGVERVRDVVEACIRRGVAHLTLFAFSSENWRRPQEEVTRLMELFVMALEREVGKMHRNGVRLKVVGELSRFDARLQELIKQGEATTQDNVRLTLTVCANYGGRWDILNAMNTWMKANPGASEITEEALTEHLCMSYAPEPDLFIRTGGESASAISCSGNWPIANCISPTPYGPTLTRLRWMLRLIPIKSVSVVLAAPVNSCRKTDIAHSNSHRPSPDRRVPCCAALGVA